MDLTGALAQGRAQSARFRPASLDAVNFLLADVRGALGPYLTCSNLMFPIGLGAARDLAGSYRAVLAVSIGLQVAAALLMAFSVATERLNLIRAVQNGSGHQDRVVPPHL